MEDVNSGHKDDPKKLDDLNPAGSFIIPVIQESMIVEKVPVETGKVRITKNVHNENSEIDIPIEKEELEVERVPINQYVDEVPEMRQEGETTIIPVLKEVIEKRIVLVEEVRITRRKVKSIKHEQVTLRKEDVSVERFKKEKPEE
jgi:uncharacterized protein (TIGR02271 family)